MRYLFLLIFLSACLTSCGYRFSPSVSHTVTVPYIEGDQNGKFTSALISSLSKSGHFLYKHTGGQLALKVKVLSTKNDKIGFQFDRQRDLSLRDNLVPSEGRTDMTVEVSLVSKVSDKVVWGPRKINATVDYDYVDPDSLQDLSFINAFGIRQTVLDASLGQLESIDSAQDGARQPLYQILSQKIVDVISAEW